MAVSAWEPPGLAGSFLGYFFVAVAVALLFAVMEGWSKRTIQ